MFDVNDAAEWTQRAADSPAGVRAVRNRVSPGAATSAEPAAVVGAGAVLALARSDDASNRLTVSPYAASWRKRALDLVLDLRIDAP